MSEQEKARLDEQLEQAAKQLISALIEIGRAHV